MTPLSQPHYDFLMEKIADKTLDFGCEVIVNLKKCIDMPIQNAIVFSHDRHRYICVDFGYDIGHTNIYHTDIDKIIGHEPSLARVLEKLGEIESDVFVALGGSFWEMSGGRMHPMGKRWDCSKDRLCDQSDETIIWLAELFGYGKDS